MNTQTLERIGVNRCNLVYFNLKNLNYLRTTVSGTVADRRVRKRPGSQAQWLFLNYKMGIWEMDTGSSSLNTIYGTLYRSPRSPRSLLCIAYPLFVAYPGHSFFRYCGFFGGDLMLFNWGSKVDKKQIIYFSYKEGTL